MKNPSIATKSSHSELDHPHQQKLFTIDLTNPSWNDEQIIENMEKRQNEYKHCFELNIKNCDLVELSFPFELIYLGKLNITRTKLTKIENLNYTANISSLNLSHNKLMQIPEIYSLTKLEMLFLNNNSIQKVEFSHFKDLRNLRIINLQNNQIKFSDVNEFSSNMHFVREKLKQLKTFSFKLNEFYRNAPKERINEFLDFFQKSFLLNTNFENEKDKLEKEFNSKIEEIMHFQQSRSESLSPIVYNIKKQIEAFSLNPNSIEMKLEKFKESTNSLLELISKKANQFKLISPISDKGSESQELEALFSDIIRDLNILTDKIDNKAFIELCMHFLVGILWIMQGYLAESIMELLTHIAENKKMEEILIKNLIKNFTTKEYLDHILIIAKGDDEKIPLIEEINGQHNVHGGQANKRDKGSNDEEEISFKTTLKNYPKILESFKMIVNEKYERLYVYLFRTLLRNIKYSKLMFSLPSAFEVLSNGDLSDKESKDLNNAGADTNDGHSFIFYAIEFFLKCFRGKAKKKIMHSLHRYEIMKLITISIGIFRKYEFYLKESGQNDKKIQSWFLEIVATFAKIFKSIFKYFYMPYMNKKVFSDAHENERIKYYNHLKSKCAYSRKDIDAFQNQSDNNIDVNETKIEAVSEYQKQKYFCEFFQTNFKTIILDIVNKDLNSKNKNRHLIFENLNEDNFHLQFENLLMSSILDHYKFNLNLYHKKKNPNSQINEIFILSNQIVSYFLKINVLIKSAFMDSDSSSYLKCLNDFYLNLYRDFAKRLDDGDYGGNNRIGATRMEKSRSNIDLRNNKNNAEIGIF